MDHVIEGRMAVYSKMLCTVSWAQDKHPVGCPALRFRYVCERKLRLVEIGPDNREERVDNRSREGIREGKGKMVDRRGCKTANSSLRPVHQFLMFLPTNGAVTRESD